MLRAWIVLLGWVLSLSFAGAVSAGTYDASLIIELNRDGAIFTCSGVLVSPNVALTAGHCAEDTDSIRVSTALDYLPNSGHWIAVARSLVHREYSPDASLYGSDVALLKLRESFPSTLHYPQLARSTDDSALTSGTHLIRIGYGGRNDQNRRTIIETLFKTWSHVGYDPIAGQNEDPHAVNGDSGGPVYFQPTSSAPLLLVGIHSTWTETSNTAYFS
ncbi:MAG: S1 family peptidase, partial [Proteobacteria bacterium]